MTLFSLKEPCPQFVRRKPLESRKTLINQGFFGYRGSFPLYGSRRLGGEVEDDAVYAFDFGEDS